MQDRHEWGLVLCAEPARDASRGQLLRVSRDRPPSVHAIGAAQLVAWGVTYYAITPLLPRIAGELALTMSSLFVAMTAGLVINAFASLAVARWIECRGARGAMVMGSITASIALLVIAAIPSAAVVFVGLVLLGAAHAALLYEPAFASVSTQIADPVARTHAIQVITFWGGWAALWALPASSVLGGWLGWRSTLVVLSALLAVATLRVHARLPALPSRSLRTPVGRAPAISTGLALAFGLGAFATTAIIVNGLLLLSGRMGSLADASIVFALLAPMQVFGRVWFMRRQGRLARSDGSIPFLLVSAGVVALLAAPQLFALAVFVVLFGAGAGLLTTIRAAVVVARVPPEHVASQLGGYSFVTSLARAFAPAVSSWIYFAAGYEVALLSFASMALFAAGLMRHAGDRVTSERRAPRPSSVHRPRRDGSGDP